MNTRDPHNMSMIKNPILPGFFPDPTCILVDGIFYLANSTFQFFPCIPIHASTDLVNWKHIDLSEAVVDGVHVAGLYAPTIRYFNKTFYIICTNVRYSKHPQNFIVTSKDPFGNEWSEPTWVDFNGIDPSLFFDDGKYYFQGSLNTRGVSPTSPVTTVSQFEIDLNTGKSLSGAPKKMWDGISNGMCPEGPHVYKKDGWYYLLIAEGGTEMGHMATMARSRNVWGPYEGHPENPVLTNKGTEELVQAVGHVELFQDQHGEWWAVSLAIRVDNGNFPMGRETFLCPVEWPEGDWPVFNGRKPLQVQLQTDHEFPVSKELPNGRRGASVAVFPHDWLFIRDVIRDHYDWKPNKHLTLKPTAANLDTVKGTSTFVGVRQRHVESVVSVQMTFDPVAEHDEAGIAAYVDTLRYYAIVVKGPASGRSLVLRKKSLHKETKEAASNVKVDERPVLLRIRSNTLSYHFEYAQHNAAKKLEWTEIGKAPAKDLSEFGFTGKLERYLLT